jgi:hypothetical protein
MNVFVKTCTKPCLLLAMLVVILLHSGVIPAAESEAGMVNDELVSVEAVPITPNFTFNFISISEGITNYPLERQLTNFFPLDSDLTIIRTWGYNADKLKIELEDEEAFGDRLAAFAIAFYLTRTLSFFGSVYSNSGTGNSFNIDIPSSEPGIVVWLFSFYQRPSVGENPYKYRITLSYPR